MLYQGGIMKLDLYFEQKMVDGILSFRNARDAPWTPYTVNELSIMVLMYQENLRDVLEHWEQK